MVLTSSSFSSKYWSHWSGTTSLKPSRKALVWPSTPRENLHSAIRLQARQYKSSLICTLNDIQRWVFFDKTKTVNLMYSSLFSSVTWMLAPLGLRSWEVIFPKISMSTEKNISRPHSSMLLSLRKDSDVAKVQPIFNTSRRRTGNCVCFKRSGFLSLRYS